MRLKLTLQRGAGRPADDVLVTVDTTVTVSALARAIAAADPTLADVPAPTGPLTLRVDDGRFLSPAATVADVGLRSGQVVSLADATGADGGAAVATLVVVAGPDAGQRFPLRAGSTTIGRERGNDVQLSDPQVSKRHLRLIIGEQIEVIDLGSSNGVLIGGEPVTRAALGSDDELQLGDTFVKVEHVGRAPAAGVTGVEFNRSPRIDAVYEGVTFAGPEPPKQQRPQRMPIIPLIVPVLLGSVMFAVTRQLVTVLFVALSPLMMVGNLLEGRVFGKRELRRATADFRAALAQLQNDLAQANAAEAAARRPEHPATNEVMGAAAHRQPMLWSRRPDQRGFLELRIGLGPLPSRNEVELPTRGDSIPGLWAELLRVAQSATIVPDVPVVADLTECGSVGVAGPRQRALGVAHALVCQLVSLHSPSEVVVAALAPVAAVPAWDWLKWLPHVNSDHSPLGAEHLASSPGAASRLLAELEDLVERRLASTEGASHLPAIVVVVEDDAPGERSRLVELAERGRSCGVHLLWIAATVAGLPAACRTFVEIDPANPAYGAVGDVDAASRVGPVALEHVDAGSALSLARALAPVVDAGARLDDDSDLPRSVSLVSLVDLDLVRSPEAVIDRWRTSNSLPTQGESVRRKKDHHLRAIIGQGAGQSLVLDLREHGPHALVGGTTGSGKSEFLQSWIMGLALEHSPARITFLFVDYKGGAAFSECVNLPHSVGLVTDLSPHLVRRALTSLNAELKHREHLLQARRAKDLLELERRGDPDAPPSLVIVVDEFAALVHDVPEFVDGVVNVAQRGRSLGLHLILATQRPAGVIKDNLRANTNLRVALRVADEADSDDVIGAKTAAGFDPSIPGRGVAKVGPGRLLPFQAGYVGGWTSDVPPPPTITIETLTFGAGLEWEPRETVADAEPAPMGPNDLERLVSNVRGASERLGLPAPRRPWLDTLAEVYDLARSPQSRTDSELVFGIEDDPANQRQGPVSFLPDRDGNMAVFGTGGAGKSAFLRTMAVVAGLGIRGGPCHVYGLDFGTRGLQVLEAMPHVGAVINGEDHERIQRLLRMLRDTIDERASRYAAVHAGSIADYRASAARPDEPRILLLVDNIGAFRQAYEASSLIRWFELFQSIAADGRQVGVHVILSADRPNSIPMTLNSVIQRRLYLRLADDNEYLTAGLDADILSASSPPGRGVLDDREVQVLVLGGSPNTSRQAAAITKLAADLRAASDRPEAPAIERLTDRVHLDQLPLEVAGQPALGIADETLAPMPFVAEDVLLVIGPPQSGKTSTMATMALSLRRSRSGPVVYLGAGRSPLLGLVPWDEAAVGDDAIAELATHLATEMAKGNAAPAGIFLENVSAFTSGSADMPLQDLVKACRSYGGFLATDSETSAMGTWSLQLAVKAARHGIALQPDQTEGDTHFKTSFPRVSRAEFPPGRGLYVRGGRVARVQVALPEVEPG